MNRALRTIGIVVGAVLVGGLLGYLISGPFAPEDGLEEVGFRGFATLIGAGVFLFIAIGTLVAARSSKGRDDI